MAAYELDKLLGLGMVPPTVRRSINGLPGSLQLWIEGCDTYQNLEGSVPATPGFSHQLSRMKMFDNLIFNPDRNARNFLVDGSANVILIDHSRAFLSRENLLRDDGKLPVQYDQALVDRLRALGPEELEERLGKILMGNQLDGILERRDRILEHVEELISVRGRASVLFGQEG